MTVEPEEGPIVGSQNPRLNSSAADRRPGNLSSSSSLKNQNQLVWSSSYGETNLDHGHETNTDEPSQTLVHAESQQERLSLHQRNSIQKLFSSSPPHPLYPGDEGFDENNAALQVVVNEWAQGTSIHGVPLVTDASVWKLWKRSVWIVLVLVSSGFMVWQITQLIRQYRSYEVLTRTETINPESMAFPRVTICNASPFSRSRMQEFGLENPTTLQEFEQISTPLEDFINRTWFNGVELPVSQSWQSTFMQGDLGRCWSFDTTEHVSSPGYYGGLRVFIDLNQYDYDDTVDFAAAIVWVQQAGTFLDTQLPIYAVKPGKKSLLSITLNRFEREQEAPWARCQGQAPEYTQGRCRSECILRYIRETCQCRRYGDATDPSLLFCPRYDPCLLSALSNSNTIIQESCTQDCNLPSCIVNEYTANVQDVDFARNWVSNFDYDLYNVTPQYLLENYLILNVNFEKIEYHLLTETKAVTSAQLLGSIGGSMGLFLGISLLSVFELVGDLGLLRLFPRWLGHRHLLGLGAVVSHKSD